MGVSFGFTVLVWSYVQPQGQERGAFFAYLALALLFGLFGWKVAGLYMVLGLSVAIGAGLVFPRLLDHRVRIREDGPAITLFFADTGAALAGACVLTCGPRFVAPGVFAFEVYTTIERR